MKRTYLLTLFSDAPKREDMAILASARKKLADALQAISQSEMETANINERSAAFLFNSAEPFDVITGRIESVTMNSDRFLLVELGQRHSAFGLNRAEFWLRQHLQS